MKKVEKLYICKNSYEIEENLNNEKTTKDQLNKNNSVKSSEDVSLKSQIDQLTNQLSNLTMILNKQNQPKYSEVNSTCFNCGKIGHFTRNCADPKDIEKRNKNYQEFMAKKSDISNDVKAMLMVSQPLEESKIMGIGQKRIRIEELISNNIPIAKNTPTTQIKIVKKNNDSSLKNSKAKPKTQIVTSAIPTRILDADAPITNRELFTINPSYLDETIKLLMSYKNSKNKNILFAENSNSKTINPINKNRPEALSYVMCQIFKQDIPLFVDIGSTSCVISKGLIEFLKIPYSSEETIVTAVGGDNITVIGNAIIPINFEDNCVFVNFQVLQECAVPIIFGLDMCQILDAVINYKEETITILINKNKLILQLYSKEHVINNYSASNEE
ncbi:hypothetical protein AYI69_g3787 [Smittium culicis]|uniref:CCHC-type domain-containing protein n=1 Tax=Smittium culicis TaxID=133412 RepID=A0A1R1YIP8_9FUNG|nr:hypothetical protein AYI69_g3787 [Smittium culicis]